MSEEVVCFGEVLMRLTPEMNYQRVISADRYQIWYGGAEANVAISMANLGIKTDFVTKLPLNDIGQSAINYLRKNDVNTSKIILGGERMGLYFMERGCQQRSSKVIYDRKNSAFSELKCGELNWEEILDGATRFHFSGITPALSSELAEITLEAVKTARKKGIRVSCDLNYRSLWDRECAQRVMTQLCGYVDDCIANDADVLQIFDYKYATNNPEARAKEMAQQLNSQFGFKNTALILLQADECFRNYVWGYLLSNNIGYESQRFYIDMVESIGGGDAFAAGFITADLNEMQPSDKIQFATAASCLKFSILGDASTANFKMIKEKADGNGNWIQR